MSGTNQMAPELAGTGTGLSMHIINDSSSRLMMLGAMLAQMLVIEKPTRRKMITGSEPEYAKTTWKVAMPVQGRIAKAIRKFPDRLGNDAIKYNSETLVVFEDQEAREQHNILRLDCVTLKQYNSHHQSFGYKYVQQPAQSYIRPREIIPKGVEFCTSPNVTPEGDYTYGREVPIAMMSVPQIIEDGIVVSDALCEAMATTIMGERMGAWGKNKFPRNLYGSHRIIERDGRQVVDIAFKAHPEQGQHIRDDGLVFAFCEIEEMHGICEMDVYTMMDPDSYDPIFDELIFGEPDAQVIDIDIMHNNSEVYCPTPVGMEVQQLRYAAAKTEYSNELLKLVNGYYRQEKSTVLSPELSMKVVHALADAGKATDKRKLNLTYRGTPIDDWNVKITFAKRVVPTIGFKTTGLHGDRL